MYHIIRSRKYPFRFKNTEEIEYSIKSFKRYDKYFKHLLNSEEIGTAKKSQTRFQYNDWLIDQLIKSLICLVNSIFSSDKLIEIHESIKIGNVSVRYKPGDDDTLYWEYIHEYVVMIKDDFLKLFEDVVKAYYPDKEIISHSEKYYGGVYESRDELLKTPSETKKYHTSWIASWQLNMRLINIISKDIQDLSDLFPKGHHSEKYKIPIPEFEITYVLPTLIKRIPHLNQVSPIYSLQHFKSKNPNVIIIGTEEFVNPKHCTTISIKASSKEEALGIFKKQNSEMKVLSII